ncbi:MAG TPA: hypothetical protein VGB85_25115 [Nannocystis sp.]|jgi:hypothetical protein
MKTHLRQARDVTTQQVASFTGEGAYHGSTRARPAPVQAAPDVVVEEMRPCSLDKYDASEPREIDTFDAHFPARYEVLDALPVPTQEQIVADGVTFCWCPIDEAIREAGPLTRSVLEAMQRRVTGSKRYVYIDSKIQYFEHGDVPVDSQHWHVDGSIAVRDERARRLGHALLHDMRARLEGPAAPPTYLSYQSSEHCATLFVTEPVALVLPELIPSFDELDRQVRALAPACVAQPAATIARFDGLSLHRAVAASAAGWRLWIRCAETDRRVELTASIIDCYGTVYRT